MARRRGRKAKANKLKFTMPFFDRGLPGAPYLKDTTWTIQQHEAQAPFGEGYKAMHRRGPAVLEQMRQEQIPQSVYCMDNQPPGPEPADDALKLDILIVEELRNPLCQGSQVVGCKIINRHATSTSSGSSQDPTAGIDDNTVVVAKFFDPMYFYHNGMFDIVELADMEYCREVAAYTHLQKRGVDGVWLPKFLGAYSLEIPLTQEQQEYLAEIKGADHPLLQAAVPVRRVRLILTEKVVGESMTYQLVYGGVKGLSDEARLDAVASTLEAYAYLYFHGVVHGDLAPRNVFILDASELEGEGGDEDTGVVTAKAERMAANGQRRRPRFYRFVDLGLAYVLGEPFSAHPRQHADETRPCNPIHLFWNAFDSGAVNMYYWLPMKLRNTPAFQRWLLQRWYGDTRFEAVGAVPVPDTKEKAWGTGEEGEGDGEEEEEEEEEEEQQAVDPEVERMARLEEEEQQKKWDRQQREYEQRLEQREQQRQQQRGQQQWQQQRRKKNTTRNTTRNNTRRCHDVVAQAVAMLPAMEGIKSLASSLQAASIAGTGRRPPALPAHKPASSTEDSGGGFW